MIEEDDQNAKSGLRRMLDE
jgi:hypothetical protein